MTFIYFPTFAVLSVFYATQFIFMAAGIDIETTNQMAFSTFGLKLLLLTESKARVENSIHRVHILCLVLKAHTESANITSVKNQHFVWLAGLLS